MRLAEIPANLLSLGALDYRGLHSALHYGARRTAAVQPDGVHRGERSARLAYFLAHVDSRACDLAFQTRSANVGKPRHSLVRDQIRRNAWIQHPPSRACRDHCVVVGGRFFAVGALARRGIPAAA